MYRTTSEKLQSAVDLFEAKRYESFDNIMGEIDPDSISPENRAHYRLLLAEVNMRRGRFDVESELTDILAYYKTSQEHDKFVRAKYLYGWLLMTGGEHFRARQELVEAFAMARRYDFHLAQARIANRLAQVNYHLGEMNAAIDNLKNCISIYGELRDVKRRLIVSANLSTVYSTAGYLTKSIENFRQLTPHIANEGAQNIASHYISFAGSLGRSGDMDSALKTIDKAIPYLDGFNYERGSYYAIRGAILFQKGQFNESRDTLMMGLNLMQDIAPDSAVMSGILKHLAETCLELSDAEKAETYTKKALDIAGKINERFEIGGCRRNLGLIYARRGDFEKSREWFRKAMDLFEKVGARYELALTRYKAAVSGVFQNNERQAFLYLAKKYFVQENVAPYVSRIDNELEGVLPAPSLKPERSRTRPLRIVTVNDEMKRLVSMAENLASSDISILLTGSTGTGKDLFARYIHHVSGRSGSFVSINAAAIPDSMVESELFGHRRGSFTNADRDKAGLIEVAHNGTLYLNEIADASKELQAKLLDVLESRKVRRLGETRERQVGFRLIAATNHDLNSLVSEGRFRIDLYHRISEVPLSLPALNDRPEDIRPLMVHFLSLAGVAMDDKNPDFQRLVKILTGREWPGNVRQLEAEAKRLALLSGGDVSRMLQFISRYRPTERDQLLEILRDSGWNRREAARKLGVSDTTIRRKIRKYRLSQD